MLSANLLSIQNVDQLLEANTEPKNISTKNVTPSNGGVLDPYIRLLMIQIILTRPICTNRFDAVCMYVGFGAPHWWADYNKKIVSDPEAV